MANIEKELADAYGEIIDVEIEAAIAEAENESHEFSPKFKKQMEELIRTGKPNNKRGLSKRGKRILIIAIAAVLALVTTACAVPEIRESIAGFFVKIFSDHVEYSDPDVTKEMIEEVYGVIPVPVGYAEETVLKTDTMVITQYIDADQNILLLTQEAGKGIRDLIDNENGDFQEYNIGGMNVRLYFTTNGAQASWIQSGYYFSLEYPSEIDLDVFIELISSVKAK